MQRISGIVLIVAVFIHFFSMLKGGALGMMQLVLAPVIAFGFFHTFNGFKMITDDYVSSSGWRGILLGVYWVAGVTLALLALKVI